MEDKSFSVKLIDVQKNTTTNKVLGDIKGNTNLIIVITIINNKLNLIMSKMEKFKKVTLNKLNAQKTCSYSKIIHLNQ